VLQRFPVLLTEDLVLEVKPYILNLGFDLGQSLFFITCCPFNVLIKQWLSHLEPSNIRFEGKRWSFMVLGHLNYKELLIADSCNPELAIDMSVLDLEIVSGCPSLGRETKGSDNTKAIVAKKLTLFTEAKPFEFTGRSDRTVRVQ